MSMDTFTIDGVSYHPTAAQWEAIDVAKRAYLEECRCIDAEKERRHAGGPLMLDDDFTESRQAYRRLGDRLREILVPKNEVDG